MEVCFFDNKVCINEIQDESKYIWHGHEFSASFECMSHEMFRGEEENKGNKKIKSQQKKVTLEENA